MKKRNWIWIAIGAAAVVCLAVVGCCCFTGMLGGIGGSSSPEVSAPTTEPGPASTAPGAEEATAASADATPRLPPDPPPPVAHRAEEVPELEAELSEIGAYRTIWQDEHREDRRLLLTGVSELLTSGGFTRPVTTALSRRRLRDAATKLFLIVSRIGRFPADFTGQLTELLGTIRSEPNLGLWSPRRGNEAPHDFAALGTWMHREDVSYLREFIASRREGPHRWTNYAANRGLPVPWLEWLALPGAAYERLGRLTTLTDDEWQAWCSDLGQERFERVEPGSGEMSHACGCTDGAGVSWEEMRERWPLTVPGGCLRCEPRQAGRVQVQLVTFTHGGRRYSVNGAAASDPRNQPIDPIWADDPEHEGLKISIGDLIGRGLTLCE